MRTLSTTTRYRVDMSGRHEAREALAEPVPDDHYIEAMLVALDVVSASLARERAETHDDEATELRVRSFRSAWLDARRLVAGRPDATSQAALMDHYLQRVA